jgi:uncharacterized phage protein gp47/JayE
MNLNLLSERQIQQQILSKLISQLGLNDVNAGSVIDVITQAVAQSDFSQYYQIAQVSRLNDINFLSGKDLDNEGFKYGITRNLAAKANGLITILRPSGFVKVATTFYAGARAPIAGDTAINVNDASNTLIGTAGTLILGRGTNNEEQVSYVTAPVNNTTYYTYTLTSPLSKDHSVEESVVLAQGSDQIIKAGTSVVVPATGNTAQINFTTDDDVTLLSGEAEIDNVSITASVAGSGGNLTVNSINGTAAFLTAPFTGARAFNPSKFTTGANLETDNSFRDRIVNYIQGISRAVRGAIYNAIVGLVDPVTAKRVVSASVIPPVTTGGDVKIYIDDGNGFEPSFNSVGFESVLPNSSGGEVRLQVQNFPVAKAQVETLTAQPYNMSGVPLTIQYTIGGISEAVTFQASDFVQPNIAQAYEIVTAINSRANLIEARTANQGQNVLITAVADTNEVIQVVGGSANAILNFPLDKRDTLSLYADDVKLSKDGTTAELQSMNQAPYNFQAAGSFPFTLTMLIDGKTANSQTATLNISDVSLPSAVTAVEVAAVLNRDLVGISATSINSNTKVQINSLTQLSSNSKLQVTGGNMNAVLGFPTATAAGTNSDYTFNRELGIIQLSTPLKANHAITIGSLFTRGKLRASNPELYSPSTGQTLVIVVDGGTAQTITFDGTFGAGVPAQIAANFINARLSGAKAIVRSVGGLNYLEINTATYSTNGSIEITSASTGNSSFQFPLDTIATSAAPDKAYVVSGAQGPYNFAQNDNLVVVVNDDIVNSTFSIAMNYPGAVSTVVSPSQFAVPKLTQVFKSVNEVDGYYLGFLSGANTDASGQITTISNQGSNIWRYTYGTPPTHIAQYAVGDLVAFASLGDSDNNGNFVITALTANTIDVFNKNGVAASTQVGTSLLGQKRSITAYNNLSGQVTVATPFSSSPSTGDSVIVIPASVSNLVDYMNNTRITSLSLKADIEGVNGNTELQIASQAQGSDGYIQVTGGSANNQLKFSSVTVRGLPGYDYWTGLVALVSKTVYGDDTDLVAFPGFGAGGITFRVLAPTVRQLAFQLQVTLANGVTLSALENQILSAVSQYVNTLGVGDDVIIERIRAAVIAITGIVDVVVSSPTANIPIGDNERAYISLPKIVIG